MNIWNFVNFGRVSGVFTLWHRFGGVNAKFRPNLSVKFGAFGTASAKIAWYAVRAIVDYFEAVARAVMSSWANRWDDGIVRSEVI